MEVLRFYVPRHLADQFEALIGPLPPEWRIMDLIPPVESAAVTMDELRAALVRGAEASSAFVRRIPVTPLRKGAQWKRELKGKR